MKAKADKAKRTVLLVDDHPLVREWLTKLINQQPDLTVCSESDDFLGAMRAFQSSPPDVAVVDISLQDCSGFQLIKDFKQIHPEVVVLVLSMHDESHFAARALAAGASGYVVKREATGKIIEAIRGVLEGRTYLSESVADAAFRRTHERQPGAGAPSVELLTNRELEVFELLGRGLGTRQIARTLAISLNTVQTHCAAIKDKLHLTSARELVRDAVRWNEARHPE
ncbi:MAG TPA: response regulator transcription factor [Candidatus Binatia bacterium]|nr:response regulator transcription factor [Candidatus Binatia bacterium]